MMKYISVSIYIWQVSVLDNTGFAEWSEFENKYIKTRNLRLNIKLILLTI